MKIFIQTFRNSIYSKKFYRDLSSGLVSGSFSYYFVLILFASTVFTAITGVRSMPTVNNFLKTAGPLIVSTYPEDLVIEIKKGRATHNKEEPVMIPFPDGMGAPFRYVIVVDTKNPFSLEKFEEYNAVSSLTNNSLVFLANNGQVRITPLKDFPDMKIDRQQIVSWIRTVQPFTGWVIPAMFFGLFVVGLFIFASYFLRITLSSMIIWGFYRLKKVDMSFKRSYQVTLHASTLPFVLIGVVGMVVPVDLPSPPFLFTIFTVIIAIINFTAKSEQSVPSA